MRILHCRYLFRIGKMPPVRRRKGEIFMSYEKSCGAVIFRYNNGALEYLLVLNKKPGAKGHWGFPKGHTEYGENEYETAVREIYEETGLYVVFHGSARTVSNYSPKEGVNKDAVYFLATTRNDGEIKLQKSELAEYRWCGAAEAKTLLTFDAPVLEKLEKMM